MPELMDIQQRPDPVLSRIAVGYRNEDAVGEQIAPVVPVQDRKGKYPKWGVESFDLVETRRAPRTKANATDFKVTWEPYDLEQHALDFEYAKEEREEYERIGALAGNNAALFNMERDGVRVTEDQLQLRREKRTGDRLRSNEIPGEAISSGSKLTESNSTPVAWSREARRRIRAATGKRMNTMLLPFDAEDALLDHPEIKAFLGQNTEQFVTTDLLRRIFRVENIILASQVYNVGSRDEPEFADVWGKDIIFAYINQNPNPSQLEQSLAYNFRYQDPGVPGVTSNDTTGGGSGGLPVLAWYDNNTETHIRRVRYEEKIQIVSPGCGYVFREVI